MSEEAPAAQPSRGRPWWERLLDRGPRWGALDISARGYGVIRYQVTVYPPGISREERLLLRWWRAAPIWSPAGWLGIFVVSLGAIAPALAFALATAVTLGAVATTGLRAGPMRTLVRRRCVVRMVGINDEVVKPELDEFRSLAEILVRADTQLDAGLMDTVEHEAEVWRVYARLDGRALR